MKRKFAFFFLVAFLVTFPSCSESESEVENPKSDSNAIDLGLSVKWAACNLGATAPEEYGLYFAWAEVSEKKEYTWSAYKYCDGSNVMFGDEITKYTGKADVLQKSDDAANVLLGDGWRIPTTAELEELIKKCKWTLETIGGHSGYTITGPNGNSIFLPFAGFKNEDGLQEGGKGGYYWSANIYEYFNGLADDLEMNANMKTTAYFERYIGMTIRPVK